MLNIQNLEKNDNNLGKRKEKQKIENMVTL